MNSDGSTQRVVAAPGIGRSLSFAVAAALIGGVMGWAGGDLAGSIVHFEVPKQPAGAPRQDPGAIKSNLREQNLADAKNGALAYAVLGGMLGLWFGIAGGLAERSVLRAGVGGLLGLTMGAAMTAAVALRLIPWLVKTTPGMPDPMIPVEVHGAIHAVFGAVAGMVFGLGLRKIDAILGGLLFGAFGGILGTFLAVGAMALVFPLESETAAIPRGSACRLVIFLCVSLVVAVSSAAAVNGRKRPARPDADTASQPS